MLFFSRQSATTLRRAARNCALAALCAGFAIPPLLATTRPAAALSEIQREDLPPPEPPSEGVEPGAGEEQPAAPAPEEGEPATEPGAAEDLAPDVQGDPAGEAPDMTVPFPDPILPPMTPETEEPSDQADDPDTDQEIALPEVVYDVERLPEPVRRLREIILEACRNADIEALRPYIATGENGTQLSVGATVDDPIAYLKEMSGDGEGYEILAIIQEVLEAGYIHVEVGTEAELYVWPYFFGIPLDRLTGIQKVELFTIVTAGDFEDMKNYGTYIFYRLGITPDGRWAFFVAGD